MAGRTALSAALHAAALLLMANWWWITAHRMHPAGLSSGSRIVLHYRPGKLAESADETSHADHPRHVAARTSNATRPKLAARADASNPSIVQQEPNIQAGDDARGDGSASLRFVQPFPDQRPDFSGQGTTGDVVVDLQIDDTGHVQRAFTRKGMGADIDSMIVATVQRWTFDPARRDGRPVASVQELHFRFDRRWSQQSCGWECINLMAQ